MAEEPSLSYYLPIAGGRIIGFIPFPRVLVLSEMQWVSSRIWTRIAVFISYGDNDYTTGTSTKHHGHLHKHHGHLHNAMKVVMSSFLSSCYNPGWKTRVKSWVFEILFPLDSARAHNFFQTYVPYAWIRAYTWIQLFEVEPQSPKVSQFQFQLH